MKFTVQNFDSSYATPREIQKNQTNLGDSRKNFRISWDKKTEVHSSKTTSRKV